MAWQREAGKSHKEAMRCLKRPCPTSCTATSRPMRGRSIWRLDNIEGLVSDRIAINTLQGVPAVPSQLHEVGHPGPARPDPPGSPLPRRPVPWEAATHAARARSRARQRTPRSVHSAACRCEPHLAQPLAARWAHKGPGSSPVELEGPWRLPFSCAVRSTLVSRVLGRNDRAVLWTRHLRRNRDSRLRSLTR